MTVIRYTTAPADYDGGGTKSLGIVGLLHGKPFRQVQIQSDNLAWQEHRYWSGFHRPWPEDEFPNLPVKPIEPEARQ